MSFQTTWDLFGLVPHSFLACYDFFEFLPEVMTSSVVIFSVVIFVDLVVVVVVVVVVDVVVRESENSSSILRIIWPSEIDKLPLGL